MATPQYVGADGNSQVHADRRAALEVGRVPMGRLKSRTAIVTGGATGIGRHYSETLAREGATVAIVDLAGSEAAAAEINSSLDRETCIAISADVSVESAVKRAVSMVLEKTGRI